MKSLKRAAAVLLSACTALTCASCGENTANAMTIDGYEVRSGIYLYYVTSAYNDAIRILSDQGESFDDCNTTADYKKIMKDINIDNITAEDWIKNKAVEYCQTFVAIERDFEAKGLKLTGEQLAAIDNGVANSQNYFGEFFEQNGIGEQSVRDIVTSGYKQNVLWEEYYGEGGSVGVEESALYDYYKDNHLRIKYIEIPLKDGEGNLLKADGKAEMEAMANDYLQRLAKKSGSEAEMMAEFDYLIDENNTYQTSISQAAVTTTDDEGNTITTETTAKVTTTEAKSTDADTTAETTTGAEGETTSEPAAETTTGDETAAETTTTTTTTAAETTDATADVTTEETTTTTSADYASIGYDTAKERILTVSTAASEDEKASAETTTTAPTYTPCEKVYNWAADANTPYNQPELIKDDECYYVVVKLDIEDRMTDDDLWSSTAKESVRNTLYGDEFQDMLDDMGAKLAVTRNEKAFRRYKVLDVDVIAYQNAIMQSYYSQYNMQNG